MKKLLIFLTVLMGVGETAEAFHPFDLVNHEMNCDGTIVRNWHLSGKVEFHEVTGVTRFPCETDGRSGFYVRRCKVEVLGLGGLIEFDFKNKTFGNDTIKWSCNPSR